MQRQMLLAAYTWRAPYFCNPLMCVRTWLRNSSFQLPLLLLYSLQHTSVLFPAELLLIFPLHLTGDFTSVLPCCNLIFWTSFSYAGKCCDKELDTSFTCLYSWFYSILLLMAVRKHRQVYNSRQSIYKGKPSLIMWQGKGETHQNTFKTSWNRSYTTIWRDWSINGTCLQNVSETTGCCRKYK